MEEFKHSLQLLIFPRIDPRIDLELLQLRPASIAHINWSIIWVCVWQYDYLNSNFKRYIFIAEITQIINLLMDPAQRLPRLADANIVL